ncbi:MAG: cell division protein FtsZ [Magnetospirillum sp. WYHS-4]
MSINITLPSLDHTDLKPRITVVGIGGAGGNAVNNMIDSGLEGVDFLVANTDAQALTHSKADRRLQLGTTLTKGLGAGARAEIGQAAAEEVLDEVGDQLRGAHMVFIAAGMGGGTGTGAAPVIARTAREMGILTVGVVTKPFHFEGTHRMRIADSGIRELEKHVDTLIIIPNQNLFRVANEKTTFAEAFKKADDVLYSGVRGVTDLMVMPGLINLDFADVRSVMSEMGKAMMGTGEADGERRALDAAEAAISNPLLDEVSMKGAKGVLINITGGADMTLFEVDEAANRIRAEVDPEANIIFGSTFDELLKGKMRVSVVATGIDSAAAVEPFRPAVETVRRPEKPLFMSVRPAVEPKPAAVHPAVAAAPAAPFAVPKAVPAPAPIMTATAQAIDPVPAEAVATAAVEPAPAIEPVPALTVAEVASVVATPAGGALDAFIPPRPVEAVVTEPRQPDAFAEAAMVNGPKADDKAKKVGFGAKSLSLFERVTGASRTAAKPAEAKPAAASTATAAPDSARPVALQPKPAVATLTPKLGGLQAAERTAAPRDDEDLLEIPAFLRRQAN